MRKDKRWTISIVILFVVVIIASSYMLSGSRGIFEDSVFGRLLRVDGIDENAHLIKAIPHKYNAYLLELKAVDSPVALLPVVDEGDNSSPTLEQGGQNDKAPYNSTKVDTENVEESDRNTDDSIYIPTEGDLRVPSVAHDGDEKADVRMHTKPPTEENPSKPETNSKLDYIDLDKEVPSVDELYEKLVLVTGFSDNHYKEAMGFIGTAQRWMPNKTIIVYDLGINNKANLQKTKRLCNVHVRKFDFNRYPKHVRNLHTYAFKIAIINITLNEFGAIYWGDSSIRFRNTLKVLIPGVERYHGWLPSILGFDPAIQMKHHSRMTVPAMYDKIGVNRTEYLQDVNASRPHIQAGNQLIFNSSTIQTKMLQPWVKCGMDHGCIAPKHSSLNNHRYDASALTLITYKYLRNNFPSEDSNLEKIQSVIKVLRDSNGFNFEPRYCG